MLSEDDGVILFIYFWKSVRVLLDMTRTINHLPVLWVVYVTWQTLWR